MKPVGDYSSNKLIVGSDNLENFAPRSDPLVKFV